jgi:tartrate dehydrogenase/decarboxylase/D-malate dehydrogenase
MVLWDDVVAEVAKEFPDVTLRKYHVDALCARMVTHPQTLDVIVASNLFGDILTDIGPRFPAALASRRAATSTPIERRRRCSSRFTVRARHRGKGIANPIAAIWAGAMMLDHLGERAAHDSILKAIEQVIGDERVKTPDLGGKATTVEMTKAVRRR